MEGSMINTETEMNALGILHWEDADGEQQEYYLYKGKTAQIGRQNDENDVVLDSSHVSRHVLFVIRRHSFQASMEKKPGQFNRVFL